MYYCASIYLVTKQMSHTTTIWKPGQTKENPKTEIISVRVTKQVHIKAQKLLNTKQKTHGTDYKMSDLLMDLIHFADDSIFF